MSHTRPTSNHNVSNDNPSSLLPMMTSTIPYLSFERDLGLLLPAFSSAMNVFWYESPLIDILAREMRI